MPVTLSSRPQMFDAIGAATDISLAAYVLSHGMLAALASAARRGARVRVHLAAGDAPSVNVQTAAYLRTAGATVELVDPNRTSCPAMHAKMAVVDGVAFLDDCNWTANAGDTILRDDTKDDVTTISAALSVNTGDMPASALATKKRDALASEAALLTAAGSAGDAVAVESESFGSGNAVYRELERLAQTGAHPRLLVSERDLRHNHREHRALERLSAEGVRIRVTDESNEKFALAGDRAWIGSANASADFSKPDQIDWGLRTSDSQIMARLRASFDDRWKEARRFR